MAWAAAIADCSPDSLLDFSASINPLGPPSSVMQAMTKALGQLRHYPDPGYGDLRHALACHHQLPADWVLPGNGAAELLTWAARDLAAAGTACHLLTPAFGDYGRALAAFDVAVRPRPLDLEGMGSLDLAASGSEPQATSILINNPHNPTGRLFALAELEPLLEQFAVVIVDEAFMDFVPPNQQQSMICHLGHHPNLVVLRSLTKFYTLPGLRIGYALGHPDRLSRWQRWRDPWPVNALAAAAAIAAVGDEAFQQHTWEWLPPARKELFSGLQAIAGLSPLLGAANYLLVKTTTPAPLLQERLLRRHQVLIRDCVSFAELGANYVRVAVRTEAENDRLLTALRQGIAV